MPSLHQRLTLLHQLLAVLCILTTSQNQVMATILPTISTAHSASSSQSRLTLLHELLVVLCTLTISKNQTMTTILPMISTAHSTSSRPMVVHLAPAAWHFYSGDSSCLRMRTTFGTASFQTRQNTFSSSRASRCRINQDPGDWYLMAAYARHHLLPFGNYMLYYFRRLVPDGSIRSPPPTPIWKLHVTLFSRSFPREDGE
jgi:hypothetical protein